MNESELALMIERLQAENAALVRGVPLLGPKLDEADRQLMLLALAILSLDRPGWDDALRRVARQLPGDQCEEMYDSFRASNEDRFRPGSIDGKDA